MSTLMTPSLPHQPPLTTIPFYTVFNFRGGYDNSEDNSYITNGFATSMADLEEQVIRTWADLEEQLILQFDGDRSELREDPDCSLSEDGDAKYCYLIFDPLTASPRWVDGSDESVKRLLKVIVERRIAAVNEKKEQRRRRRRERREKEEKECVCDSHC